MFFYLIGIDYKNTPIGIREGIYSSCRKISDFWNRKANLLITCNRIEIYGVFKTSKEAYAITKEFFKYNPYFATFSYAKYGEEEVFRHALRLASGLESQLKGELQILHQLKKWHLKESLPIPLRELWNKALILSEEIRSRSGLDNETDNIGDAVFYDLEKRLGETKPFEIIVVGTGKIAELIARLRPQESHLNFVSHKNFDKAKLLAERSGGEAFLLKDLQKILSRANALISATSSPHYVLKKEHFTGLENGLNKTVYLYDLAIPRDIEPDALGIKGLFLQNLDDLNWVFGIFNQKNEDRINLASYLIEETLSHLRGGQEVIYDK